MKCLEFITVLFLCAAIKVGFRDFFHFFHYQIFEFYFRFASQKLLFCHSFVFGMQIPKIILDDYSRISLLYLNHAKLVLKCCKFSLSFISVKNVVAVYQRHYGAGFVGLRVCA